jgi:NAD(P)H-hydrate epimerase
VARNLYLSDINVVIASLSEPVSEACKINRKICENLGISIITPENFSAISRVKFDTFVDAGFGSGFNGELPEHVLKINKFVSGRKVIKVAIDNVSGLNLESGAVSEGTLPADITIAVGAYKKGYFTNAGLRYSGKIYLVDIGLIFEEDAEYWRIFEKTDFMLPDRKHFFHKGAAGKVAVMGGSRKYTGAPLLSSSAAFNAGAGYVYCLLPGDLKNCNFYRPGEIIFEYTEKKDIKKTIDFLNEKVDTLLAGPGTDFEYDRKYWLELFKGLKNKNIIIDADLFKILSPADLKIKGNNFILTPHIVEFAEFIKKDYKKMDIIKEFEAFAKKYPDLFLILKKPGTLISYKGQKFVIPRIADSLAHAGTGDVLAGIIAGFCAQSQALNAEVVLSAVFAHVYTALRLSEKKFTGSITPTDIILNMGEYVYELR